MPAVSVHLDAGLDVVRDAPHTISSVLVHRIAGTARKRRRIPRGRYPKSVEVAYASSLVGIVDLARQHTGPLLKELPHLLAQANAYRATTSVHHDAGGVFLARELDDLDQEPNDIARRYAESNQYDAHLGPVQNATHSYLVHAPPARPRLMIGFRGPDDAINAFQGQRTNDLDYKGVTAVSIDEMKRNLIDQPGTTLVRRQDAGESARAVRLVQQARDKLVDAIHPNAVDALARRFAKRTTDTGKELLRRQTRAALGVDIATLDKKVPTLVDHFAHENVALIKSLGNRTMDDVEKAVTRAFTSGTTADDLADDIENRFGIAERHARLIARDQIGKLNGQVTAARHQELGVKSFTWETAGDDRVRDEHVALAGQTFTYEDPPSEGLPGEPVCCRCSASPDFESLLDDIDAAEGDDE